MNPLGGGSQIDGVMGRAQGGAAFSPLLIAGCAMWFDASQITGLSDGDSVTTWADASGNGNNATQSTASARPTYKTGIIGGKPVLRFDGGDWLSLANYMIPASLTHFAVIRRATAGTHAITFGETTTNRYPAWWYNDNVIYTQYGTGFNTHGSASTSTGNFVLTSVKSTTTSSIVRRNGAQVGTTQTPSASSGNFSTIGRIISAYNVADIAEIILYGSALSDANRQTVEAYLSAKYGISLA